MFRFNCSNYPEHVNVFQYISTSKEYDFPYLPFIDNDNIVEYISITFVWQNPTCAWPPGHMDRWAVFFPESALAARIKADHRFRRIKKCREL
jgi:hypothetical protein